MPCRCINPCVKDAEQASLGWHAARRAPVRRSPAELPRLSPMTGAGTDAPPRRATVTTWTTTPTTWLR